MKHRITLALAIAISLSGCMFGPRPFDGSLGYQTQAMHSGLQVTYIEEEKVSREKVLQRIATVCAEELSAHSSSITINVESESIHEKQVSMSVSIPVGFQDTGRGSGTMSGPNPASRSTASQNDVVSRSISVREIVAVCSK